MGSLVFQGNYGISDNKYYVKLSLIEFKEDDSVIIYSPALDLAGYGGTVDEAKQSFNTALHEFLRYTHNKKTFESVLNDLGWKIKGSKKNKKMHPPLNSELAQKNPLYNDIINSKNHRVFNEDVEFAV